MRIFLSVLILIFCLQSLTKADDIRDFEIEGMSIGDSLLDFFSDEEIKLNINHDSYNWKSEKKFVDFEFYDVSRFKVYDGVQISIKNNDKKYIIHAISGGIFYDNIEKCYSDMKIIVNDLHEIFPSAITQLNQKLNHPTKKGTALSNWFNIDGGHASVMCTDWNNEAESELGFADSIRVEVRTLEYEKWL